MSRFTEQELRQRAFYRAAWVLKHFWEEQQDDIKQEARVSTRIFDHLIYIGHIKDGKKSKKGGGHKEHLVPCAKLRDEAFKMYWAKKNETDVAKMLEKYLRVADIHPEEAHDLDHKHGLKTDMPKPWDFETGSVMARLEFAGIELED